MKAEEEKAEEEKAQMEDNIVPKMETESDVDMQSNDRPLLAMYGFKCDICGKVLTQSGLEPSHSVIQSLKKNFYSVLILHFPEAILFSISCVSSSEYFLF